MRHNNRLSSIIFSSFMIASSNALAKNDCQILEKSRPSSTQIIVVKSLGGFKANMTLCQRQNNRWNPIVQSHFKAVIGKNGVVSPNQKKEGDLKTPKGLYPIGQAFGTHPLALKMDYKFITADDKFIDDVNHKLYNTWVSGPTDAKSYESMLIEPYTYGAVINYNMNPIIKGAGSAIFLHLWRSPNSPTSGCIALDKKHLLTTLHWLDKNQHPYILLV